MNTKTAVMEIKSPERVIARKIELKYAVEGLKQWLVDHPDASITAVRHVRDLIADKQEALDLLNKKSI